MKETTPDNHPTRESMLAAVEREPSFDLAVIGGGIHGAACAYIGARAGLRTLLLERSDFASGTSSRSSKMAHGGLRYLEMFDFKQVFEGIKAREVLFEQARSLVKPARFLIPVNKNDWWFRTKLEAGLTLYDLMVRNRAHTHRFVKPRELSGTVYHSGRNDLMGCFEYTDGIMNDSRVNVEVVLAACRAGALCLNYVEIEPFESGAPGRRTGTDRVSGRTIEVRFAAALNCAGPWAPALIGVEPRSVVRFSQGSHLLFSKQWTDPPVFLPVGEKGHYYWVWPHPYGAMAGTTEREIDEIADDPVPFPDEVDEILQRLERDVPYAGLDRNSLHYGFAGVRTLPLRAGAGRKSSQLSRKHIWRLDGTVLTLLGGKYTTFHWTACEGVKRAAALLGRSVPAEAMRFPLLEEHAMSASSTIAERVSKASGELVVKLDDIMRRRLDVELMPGQGTAFLPSIASVLAPLWGEERVRNEIDAYMNRINRTRTVLGLPLLSLPC
jgi:glycerol-3-phosphate dehydrogenase